MPLRRLRIPPPAELSQRSRPFGGELGVRFGDRDPLTLLEEGIHANDRPLPTFELDLIAVRRIRDLQLDPTGLDPLAHAAPTVHFADQGCGLRPESVRQGFDHRRSAAGTYRVR